MDKHSQYKYIQEYKKKAYDRILIEVPKGTKDKWKAIAADHEQSLQAYIKQAVEDRIENGC